MVLASHKSMGGTSHFGPTGFRHDDMQSAMKELLRRAVLCNHCCYRCEDQPVKHLVCGRVKLGRC